ncbi:MAG: hypothetical protein K6E76_07955 [Patescibacteria group bacterium]|nr:hypothetical protein [Patescibacteria group bacterium]
MIQLTPEKGQELIEEFNLRNNHRDANPLVIVATAAAVATNFIDLARERKVRNLFGDSDCKEEIADGVFDEAEESLFKILLKELPSGIYFRYNASEDSNLRVVKNMEKIEELIPMMTCWSINWKDGSFE